MSAPTHRSSGRLVAAACVVALGVACSAVPDAEVDLPSGERSFVAMIADSVDDVGLAPSVAIGADGIPYVSYFGFTAQLAPNEIPVSRPIGSPYLDTEEGDPASAVLLTALSPESQVWIRGAAAQARETPSGITVPFGPAADPSLSSLTTSNAVGTDVAVAGSDIHVVWAGDTGLSYGVGADFEVERIERGAGIGAPSIAVADDGTPIVAYTVAGAQPEVRVAERSGETWTTTTVATLSACGTDCPPPTSIAVVGGEPLVVVTDPAARQVIAARRSGGAWATQVVATGVAGGASLAAAGDAATVAYYTPQAVGLATGGATGGWSSQEIATVTPRPSASATPSPSPTTGVSPSPAEGASPSPASQQPIETEPVTAVAVDGEGRTWVAWEDADGIHLASAADDGSFEEQDLGGGAEDGVTPSLAVTEDGAALYLAWFEPLAADLFVGVATTFDDILLAAPSPTPAPPEGGQADDTCGQDGQIALEIVAVNTSFDPTCLVAPAGEPFTVTFENQDDQVPHNWEFMTEPGSEPIAATEAKPGVYTDTLDVEPQDAGSYYFQCIVHPDVMTGTLAVIEGGGGGQGGGDQGGNGGDGGGGGEGGA